MIPPGGLELLALVVGTFVTEDLTTMAAGFLAADGRVHLVAAIAAVAAGIWAGDLGLWYLGRLGGPALRHPWVRARLLRAELDAMGARLTRHAGTAIVLSRFLPGTRLAVYLGAGAFGVRASTFALWSAFAVVLWVPPIVIATAVFGEAVARPLRTFLGAGWVILPIGLLVLWRGRRIGGQLSVTLARLRRWEFWPPWAFYLPIVPWIGWLMARFGARALAAANPGFEDGGFVGESKTKILGKLPESWTLPYAQIAAGDTDERLAAFDALVGTPAFRYPLILKPDVGQRGEGVRLVRTREEAAAYLAGHPRPVLVQAYHSGPYEAGVFYYRFPGESRGRIFSITDKQFPIVVGDGETPLEGLIRRHARYRLQSSVFFERHRARLATIPAPGELVRLAVAGNHAQGTTFLDGASLETPALAARMDEIARRIDGFFVGRFDVRYRDPRRFMAGEDFGIVELNGVTSEATHIYDPSTSLWTAYRTLFRQWSIVFRIGAANLAAGCESTSFSRLVRLSIAHLRRGQVLNLDVAGPMGPATSRFKT